MESHIKKDGAKKTLFDYSPQNQNYLIIDDLMKYESDNNLIPEITNKKQAEKIYHKIGAKFGSWQECTPRTLSYRDKKRYLQVNRYKFKNMLKNYRNVCLVNSHKDAPRYNKLGRWVP